MTKTLGSILLLFELIFNGTCLSQFSIGIQAGRNSSHKVYTAPGSGDINEVGFDHNYGVLAQLNISSYCSIAVNPYYINKSTPIKSPILGHPPYIDVNRHAEFFFFSVLLKLGYPIESFKPYFVVGPSWGHLNSVSYLEQWAGNTYSGSDMVYYGKQYLNYDIGLGLEFTPFKSVTVFIDGKYSAELLMLTPVPPLSDYYLKGSQVWAGILFNFNGAG